MKEEILMGRCGVCGNIQEFSAWGWRSNIRQQFRCNNCWKLRLFSYAGKKPMIVGAEQ